MQTEDQLEVQLQAAALAASEEQMAYNASVALAAKEARRAWRRSYSQRPGVKAARNAKLKQGRESGQAKRS